MILFFLSNSKICCWTEKKGSFLIFEIQANYFFEKMFRSKVKGQGQGQRSRSRSKIKLNSPLQQFRIILRLKCTLFHLAAPATNKPPALPPPPPPPPLTHTHTQNRNFSLKLFLLT